MSYIGSSAAPLPIAFAGQQGQSFNGGTNTFTLSRAVSRTLDIDVVINNVIQNPYDGSYNVNGTTLTTAETVSAGVGNVYVIFRDAPIGSFSPIAGSVTPSSLSVGAPTWDANSNLSIVGAPSAWGGGYKGIDVQYGAIANTGNGAVDVSITQNAYYNGTNWIAKYTGASKRYSLSDSGHIWYYGASVAGGSAITWLEAMRFDSSVNGVFMGTTGVYHRAWPINTYYESVTCTGAAVQQVFHRGANNGYGIGADADGSFGLWTANYSTGALTNVIKFDASGNMAFNGTPSGYYAIETFGGGADSTRSVRLGTVNLGQSGGDYPWVGYNFRATTSSGVYKFHVADYSSAIRFQAGGVETFTTTSVGTAGGTITYTSGPSLARGAANWAAGASDVRQKKNFEPSQGLAELMQIEAVKYHFQWDADTSPKRLGFKAQNLLTLIPEMVVTKDELHEDGTPLLTITPDYMLPVLVKAIQEQQALIAQLQADVAALKA